MRNKGISNNVICHAEITAGKPCSEHASGTTPLKSVVTLGGPGFNPQGGQGICRVERAWSPPPTSPRRQGFSPGTSTRKLGRLERTSASDCSPILQIYKTLNQPSVFSILNSVLKRFCQHETFASIPAWWFLPHQSGLQRAQADILPG